MTPTNLPAAFQEAQTAMQTLDRIVKEISEYKESAALEIAKNLRMSGGLDLDPEAIRATVTRPYTLLPINDSEAWLIHWAGVKMPIFGQVIAREKAFIKAKITRTMNLITPLPAWVMDEAGWSAPEHNAVIDSAHSTIQVTNGDELSFRRRYRQFLGARRSEGTFTVKGGDAWIRLVASLVKDGILPYRPTPVDSAHWDANATIPEELAAIIAEKEEQAGFPYIHEAVQEFINLGAVLLNLPPGAGKSLASCLILNHFRGKVLILVDSTFLEGQWHNRLKRWAPRANVTVSTYQGAQRYAKEKWDLILPDEAQRLPATTFSKLAFIQTLYRCGLTATPWREDNRQHLIVALCGHPVSISWNRLMALGVLKTPRIVVVTVPTLEAKTGYTKSLLGKHKGRGLIYCDWLEQGENLAKTLDVPFIQGSTKNKLEVLEANKVVVVSRVGDRGLDIRDLNFVIEVAGAGTSREQFAQRVGRLLHSQFNGIFYTVFTPDELTRYRSRLWGVEAETGGAVEIEFIEVGKVPAADSRSRVRAVADVSRKRDNRRKKADENDEISQVFTVRAVTAKISQVKRSVGTRTAPYVERVLRYTWSTSLNIDDICDGLAISDPSTRRRIGSACRAAQRAGLMIVDDQQRYKVDLAQIERLRSLAGHLQ